MLNDYDNDTGKKVVDLPFPDSRETEALAIPRERTVVYHGLVGDADDSTLRAPADPLETKFPIMMGFERGAEVDVIPRTISQGAIWTVGRAKDADGPEVVWLSDINLPYEQWLAAWWVMP